LVDKITTFIFTFEMCLKIISYGFVINGPNSFLRTGWNILGLIPFINLNRFYYYYFSIAFNAGGG